MATRRGWITAGCVAVLAAAAGAQEGAPPNGPRPQPPWIAAEARLGGAWVAGGALRDADGARGTQVAFGRDLDLDGPAAAGAITIHARLGRGWRVSGELAWTSFEGRAVQGGGSFFNPTPPTLVFDGVAFTSQTLESELDLLIGAVGLWKRGADFDDVAVDLGLGAHGIASELAIAVAGGGGAEADERSQAATPWVGGELRAPLGAWVDSVLGGRVGFLWGGDRVRYHLHALLDLWAEASLVLGPLRVGVRVDYRLIDTHERARGRDELLDVSLVVASVMLGVRF